MIAFLFPTPFYRARQEGFEDVNAELFRMIEDRADPGSDGFKSVVGGWHSELDLTSWGGEAVATLCSWIQTAVAELTAATFNNASLDGDWTVTAWANYLTQGGYNAVHDHADAAWSGAYWVHVPDDPGKFAGLFEFIDPRLGIGAAAVPGNPFRNMCRIEPEPGTLLVFPGWLKHMVHPITIGPRVSISFNVRWKPCPP